MDRSEISALTHGDLPFANPLAAEAVDGALRAIEPPRGARALDVGCGRGELLARLKALRPDIVAVGVEPAPAWAAAAEQRLDRVLATTLDDALASGALAASAGDGWDLVCCLGSSHAFGTWRDALEGLAELTRPGGSALLGEGFWRRAPSAGYLEALGGATPDELPDHAALRAAAEAAGFDIAAEATASDADWAAYEETLLARGEAAYAGGGGASGAGSHGPGAGDADLRAWLDAARARWEHPDGKDTLGFTLLTLRRR